jgi:D-beta-D-heptose 7-phosphate kinase/D-beta-D-heptose 1-phosphate adenosyltransferase
MDYVWPRANIMDELIRQIDAFGQPKVIVLGDFMLDRTVRGHAERLSPDAPVPVLNYAGAESTTGGAGHVATALVALGARAVCVGLVGTMRPGEKWPTFSPRPARTFRG